VLTCLVACTASKSLEPSRALQARRYRGLPLTEALEAWSAALDAEHQRTTVARLYKGVYWSVARRLVQDTHLPMRALVASAGLGVRGFDERVPSYAATFNHPELDTIPEGNYPSGRLWWWRHTGGRRRLRAVAEEPGARIAVALPGQYLHVALPDLIYLQNALGPRALTVFTTDEAAIDELGGSAVPLEGRMSRVLGGTAGQLTVRALDHVVRSAERVQDVTPGRARRLMRDVLEEAPPRLYPQRKKQSQDEARAWIQAALDSDDPPTSATAALRRFRGEGLGHEQKRFTRIFREIEGGSN